MAKIKKYQAGGKTKMVESEMFPGKKIPISKSNYATGKIAKMAEAPKAAAKAAVKKAAAVKLKKAQKGASVDSLSYYKKKASEFDKEAQRMTDSSSKYYDKTINYIDKMSPAERKAKGVSKTVNKDKSVTYKYKSGGKLSKAKGGKEMIKRADGSYSQRGLWDNIRANRGSGKKPTAAMLKQEKKIKAKGK